MSMLISAPDGSEFHHTKLASWLLTQTTVQSAKCQG